MHISPQYAPNLSDSHKSISITGTASTLAQLGATFDRYSAKFTIQANGANVRYTVNGTAPTTTTGLLLVDGASISMDVIENRNAKFIAVSGSPKLEIASYKKI